MSERLRDRVAIVTGAGRGIGEAVARRLAAEGAAVTLGDLNEVTAKETARAISEKGGRALALRCDVGDRAAVDAMVRATVEHFVN